MIWTAILAIDFAKCKLLENMCQCVLERCHSCKISINFLQKKVVYLHFDKLIAEFDVRLFLYNTVYVVVTLTGNSGKRCGFAA